MDNKNNKGLIAIIILLILLLIGVELYGAYDKGLILNKNNTENNNQTEEKDEQKDIEEDNVTFSDSELETYVNYISPMSIGPSPLIYNKDHVSSKNLSAADKIKYIGSHLYRKHTSTPDYSYDIIAESEVKKITEKIYGPNSYKRTIFNIGCGDYILNESEGNYYSKTGCGGTTDLFVKNVVIGYKATKNKLEITTAYVFIGGTNEIYKDYNRSISLGYYTDESGEFSVRESYLEEYIKNNKDNLYHIVYTFESTDGINYYFKEFTNNK